MKKKNGQLFTILGVILIGIGLFLFFETKTVDKNAFIDTVKQMITKVKAKTEEGKYGLLDSNTLYFIPENLIEYEKNGIDFKNAYVVVTYDGSDYIYYFIGVNKDGLGMYYLTKLEDLNNNLVKDIGRLGNLNKLFLDGYEEKKIYIDDGTFTKFEYVDEDIKDVPKPDNCDDCVFKFSRSEIWTNDILDNYEYDYRKIDDSMFLGFSIDYNNKVEKIYACGIVNRGKENEKAFCLESPSNDVVADYDTNYLYSIQNYFKQCSPGLDVYKDKGVYCSGDILANVDRKKPDTDRSKSVQIESPDINKRCYTYYDNLSNAASGSCSKL